MPLHIQHNHTGRQVVQNRLQIGAGRIDLAHALLHGRTGIKQLLRHVAKGAGEPAQLVAAVQRGFRCQVTARHLAHPFSQHQQRLRQLVAQNHCQQHCAEYRQKKTQCQGSDVHLAQTTPGQRALLVLAVGILHSDGIGHQRGGQGFNYLQKTHLAQHIDVGAVNHCYSLDTWRLDLGGSARCCRGAAGSQFTSTFEAGSSNVFQPFYLRDNPLATGIAQLLRRRPFRLQQETGFTRAGDYLARPIPQHHVAHQQLIPQTLQWQADAGVRRVSQLAGRLLGFVRQVIGQGVQRGTAQIQTCSQRAFDFHIKPAFNGPRHKLIGHGVNHQAW